MASQMFDNWNYTPEKGGRCKHIGCKGTYELDYSEGGCTCFIVAPCSRCENISLVCTACGEPAFED